MPNSGVTMPQEEMGSALIELQRQVAALLATTHEVGKTQQARLSADSIAAAVVKALPPSAPTSPWTVRQQMFAIAGVCLALIGGVKMVMDGYADREVTASRVEARLTSHEARIMELGPALGALRVEMTSAQTAIRADVQELKSSTDNGRRARDRTETILTQQLQQAHDSISVLRTTDATALARVEAVGQALAEFGRRVERIEEALRRYGNAPRPGGGFLSFPDFEITESVACGLSPLAASPPNSER